MTVKFTELERHRIKKDDFYRALSDLAITNLRKVESLDDASKRQKLKQKQSIFNMVFWMTIVTYTVVLIMLISQIMNIEFDPFKITFLQLSDQTLGIILTGFLAELLLLPKIILEGLFGAEKNSAKT